MNKRPIILLVGKSGSGKNYFTSLMKKRFDLDEVISRTTRQPRYEGENTHLFISKEQAEKEINDSIAYTWYCENHYYVLEKDLKDKAFYVIDERGVETFKNSSLDIPHVVVYYNVPLYVRFFRMLKRGDKFKDVIKRLINDHKDFNKMDALCDIKVKNMDQLINVVYVVGDYRDYNSLKGLLSTIKLVNSPLP